MSLLDRMIKASVDRAAKMQPRRVERVVNEHLYAAPTAREEVSGVAEAAHMLRSAGFAPAHAGAVAVRRSDTKATVTEPGADLGAIDNRTLTAVDLDAAHLVLHGIRAGAAAAVLGYPPHLLALALEGRHPAPAVAELAAISGDIHIATLESAVPDGITIDVDCGALATADDPVLAVAKLEAAETLAHITLLRSTP